MNNGDIPVSLEDVFENYREALVVLDENMHVLLANRLFYEVFQTAPTDTKGHSLFEIGNGQWNIPELRHLLQEVVQKKKMFSDLEVHQPIDKTGEKILYLQGHQIITTKEKPAQILLVIDDITERKKEEQKNLEYERQFRNLLEKINSIVIQLDHSGRITYFNHFSEKIFGYSRDEVIGREFVDTIIPCIDQFGRDCKKLLSDVLQNPDQYYINETVVSKKDGSTIMFSWSASVEKNEDGSVKYVLIDGNDITEMIESRKEAESALKLVNISPDIIARFTPDGRYVFVNKALEALTGKSTSDLKEKKITETGTPLKIMNQLLDNLKIAAINDREVAVELSNESNIYHTKIFPEKDHSGKIISLLAFSRDITDLKKTEASLRIANETLTTLIDSIPVMITLYDSELHISDLNKTFENVTGWSEMDVRTHDILELTIPDKQMRETARISMQKVDSGWKDVQMTTRNGKKIHTLWGNTGLPDGRIAGIGINITERTELLERLREREEMFRTLADNISQLVWMADPQGEVFWYNQRWYEFTGTTYEIMKKEGVKKIIHSDHADHIMESFKVAINRGEPWEDTFLMRKNDGSFCWFLTRAMPIRDNSGIIIRWFGTNTDITQLRELQNQLRSTNDLFQTIFDRIPVMLTIYDPNNITFTANSYLEKVSGWNRDDIQQANIMEKAYPDPDYRKYVLEFMQSHVPEFRDIVMTGKNGDKIESTWSNVQLPDGRQVGIGIDIRERKAAEREMRISAERFNCIISSNIIGCVIGDFNGRITYVNNYYLNIIGYSRSDYENGEINWFQITPPDQLWIDRKALDELREKGSAFPYEKQYVKKDGTRVWVSVSGVLLPGQQDLIFSFVLDITKNKHLLNEMQRRQAEIAAILESIPDGYILYNSDGTIRKMNERARQIIGFSPEEEKQSYRERMEKLNVLRLDGTPFPLNDLPDLRALHGETVRDVIMQIHKLDRNFWISVSASPIPVDGRYMGAIMEFSDVTHIHFLQEKLTEEHNFIETILQTSGALITVFDKNGKALRFNRACEEVSGYSADEVSNRSIIELCVPEEERNRVDEVVRKILAGEKIVNNENHWITRDGGLRYIRWRNAPLLGENGIIEYIIASGIDITDLKQTEAALRESDERYRLINQATHDIIWDLDLKTNKIVWGDAIESVLGISKNELLATYQCWYNHVHPEDRDFVVSTFQNAIEKGEHAWSSEYRFGKPGGPYRVYLDRGLISRTPEGRAYRVIGSMLDITDRKQGEKALRESEERFRTLADNISQLAWIADKNGKSFWFNKRWLEYTGTTPEEMMGDGWKRYPHPDYLDKTTKSYFDAVSKGIAWEYTFPIRSATGEYRWFLSRAMPIKNEKDEIVRWFGTNTDITEQLIIEENLRKQTEELARLNNDLESFSYSVAHDLRSPLNAIKGFASLLKEGEQAWTEDSKNFLSRIMSSSEKMNSIIEDLLALSKLSRQEMQIKNVNLSTIVQSVINDLLATQPDRRIIIRIDDGLEVRADTRLISVAINNLISNAWKYTSKNAECRIEFGSFEKDRQKIYYVKDNGVGFDMHDAAKLFIPFKRLHSNQEFSGTGVGLAIVERAIKRHGGRIWAESEPGKGATFYFTLQS